MWCLISSFSDFHSGKRIKFRKVSKSSFIYMNRTNLFEINKIWCDLTSRILSSFLFSSLDSQFSSWEEISWNFAKDTIVETLYRFFFFFFFLSWNFREYVSICRFFENNGKRKSLRCSRGICSSQWNPRWQWS